MDWFRREIEEALTSRRNIIPIMLDGFGFDAPWINSQLPDELSSLRAYNAITVPIEYFDAAMEKLRCRFLQIPLGAVVHPASNSSRTIVKESREAALLAPLVRETTLTAQEYLERGVATDDVGIKLACFNDAIRLQPDLAEAYYQRGDLYRKRDDFNQGDDFKRALSDYSAAIRHDGEHFWAYSTRAALYQEAGKLKLALKDCNEGIRISPDFGSAYWYRGRVLTELGQLQRALSDYDMACEIGVGSGAFMLFRERGKLKERLGDPDGAAIDFGVSEDAIGRLRSLGEP